MTDSLYSFMSFIYVLYFYWLIALSRNSSTIPEVMRRDIFFFFLNLIGKNSTLYHLKYDTCMMLAVFCYRCSSLYWENAFLFFVCSKFLSLGWLYYFSFLFSWNELYWIILIINQDCISEENLIGHNILFFYMLLNLIR